MSESVAPTVSSVSSDNSSAGYSAGSNISIKVTFSESVFVDNSTGNPRIELETGSTDRYANYSSGNSSSVLYFIYTVVSGDNSTDLDYKSTSSLSANSGTIRDNSSNDATLTLPSPGPTSSLETNKAIVIDTTAPTAILIRIGTSYANFPYEIDPSEDHDATVQSTETGTAYLVNTTVSVSNNFTSITGAADSQWNSVAISLANTDTNLPATGLADGTYKVYAVDAAGNLSSASSNSVTVATTYNLPAPNNFSASGTSNTVTLSWNSVSGALSYTLYWDNVSGIDSSDNRITPISTDNYTHSGLDNGTTYYYKVAAVDSTGTMGTLSSEVNASTPLPAPDNLSASGANNTITLTWNSVSGATSYTLYWDNVSGIDNSDTPINSITNDNYTHSNMDNGSIYYYKVAAVNSSGTGTLSSVASALLSSYVKDSASLSGHTFAITSAAMNWNNAKVQATALGGYLTTVNSKAENDWLTTRFRIQHGAELWIGANDIATNNTWVWDNGTTDNDNGLTDNICGSNSCPNSNATWADGSTRKWNSGEPNHSGASCGYIWKTSGRWDDVACSINKYAIIEFD